MIAQSASVDLCWRGVLCVLAALPALQGAEHLSLEQAFALAEKNNPQLRLASAQIEVARGGVLTAQAYLNPEVGVIAGRQHARAAGAYPGMAQVFNFVQPLELKNVRQTRIHAAVLGRESSQFLLTEARVQVRAAVKQTFYQVLRRRGEIGLASENLRLVEELRRRILAQVEVGEAARLELSRADAELAVARTMTSSAQLRLVSARSALRAAISAPIGEDVELEGVLDPPVALPALETLRNEVLSSYPALNQARAEVSRAEARLKAEAALRTPQPTLRAEWEQQPDVATYRVGVSLPLPLWNKRQGPIAEATAALEQSRAAAEVRRIEIVAALEGAYGRYQVASQQVTAFEQGVLREAEAALRAAETAYKFGERGIIDVLDAQRVLRSARGEHLSAQYDRQAALIELEQLRAVELGTKKP